ncbi:teichoic acid transport system ATP-binding protein [Lachnotalea glycerini]|uniref:ABC transporter ATP-binding protein n=1 Tax=Lachnotalea glycerini TaxID=1763509 RepID=A0A318ESB7_9FIRM|nr:ABC transporter ATP-binding protein [Lachnotalea glycerini]PXV91457.1 teichoic acid transport system ATP-binding protein [Lachnotalea glycerini]RDY31727.1 ABC transporter ATP-binding protein [Lachnotalea glycerini]
MSSVISIKNVTKIYKLYNKSIDRLKEVVHPFHKQYNEPFYALNDISFEIEKGETVGIIGTNGSGKSTILKIITGVLQQTKGEVSIDGTVSALLELGAGFDLDYTGIENIYMNGAILGFSPEEMDRKKEEILEFADIGDFVNQPVKTYSSGMMVRLAFALAINVEPEILIIDEALAVGDAFFQAKCFHKLEEIKNAGTTILFVSHDIVSVKKLCKRAIWLDRGNMREIGEAKEVCEKYLSMQIEEQNREMAKLVDGMSLDNTVEKIINGNQKSFKRIQLHQSIEVSGTKQGEILSFYIKNEKGQEVMVLPTEQSYTFGMLVKFNENIDNVLFGFEMENVRGVKLFSVNNFLTNEVLQNVKVGELYEVSFELRLPRICTGEYLVSPSLAAGSQDSHVVLERIHNYLKITIDNDGYNLSIIDLDTKAAFVKYKKDDIVLY